jgi:hypothetical protein
MAKTPKKVTSRLSKDVREVIREMSKAPFGKPGKVSDFPKLTTAEAEELKAKQKKVPSVTVTQKNKLQKNINTVKIAGGNAGKGTPLGDAKDAAMRKISNAAIVELQDINRQSQIKSAQAQAVGKTSSETSLLRLGPASGNLSGKVIMLARNGKLANQPLRPETVKAITAAYKAGAKFVVGDMPGVDSEFIKLLDKLNANYRVYHTGDSPRIKTNTQPTKLTPQQIESNIKQIAKDRAISYNLAKEMFWEELKKSPKTNPVNQPTVLSKAIPTRAELESTGYRAVKYQGKTIYLSPAQVKQIAKDLGIKVDFKGGQTNLFGEGTKGQYEKITGISPEARSAIDRKAAAEAERLRTEAMRDWQAQSKASVTNKMVRPPAEQLKAVSAASPKAEAYAERLYKKAFQTLTPKERKAINMIIEEEARRAQKATSSRVGQGIRPSSYKPPMLSGGALGGILGFGGGGLLDQPK